MYVISWLRCVTLKYNNIYNNRIIDFAEEKVSREKNDELIYLQDSNYTYFYEFYLQNGEYYIILLGQQNDR